MLRRAADPGVPVIDVEWHDWRVTGLLPHGGVRCPAFHWLAIFGCRRASSSPVIIPVNIPVEGGARIDCFVDLNTAVTNAAEVLIGITYE